MQMDYKALKKMDLYVVNKPWSPEERATLSKYLAESKKKNAKLIARIEASLKKKKTAAKAKSRKAVKA